MTGPIIAGILTTLLVLLVLILSLPFFRSKATGPDRPLSLFVEDETLDPDAGEFVVPLPEVPRSLVEAIDMALKATTDPERRDHLLEARIAATKERAT